MKKHTITAYRKSIRLFGLLGLISFFLFPSCEDLQADDCVEKCLSPSKAYTVSFKIEDLADTEEDSSSESERTIYPSKVNPDGLSFFLKGEPIKSANFPTPDGDGNIDWSNFEYEVDGERGMAGDQTLLSGIQYPTKKELDEAKFNLDAGAWKFELKAYSNAKYRATDAEGKYSYDGPYDDDEDLRFTAVSFVEEITAGNNIISFNMELADDKISDEYKKGSIKIILDCYLGLDTCSTIGDVEVTLEKIDGEFDFLYGNVSQTESSEVTEKISFDDIEQSTGARRTIIRDGGITEKITVWMKKTAVNNEYTPVTYETSNNIPKGTYFLSAKIPLVYDQTRNRQTEVSYEEVVIVETGSQSFLKKSLNESNLDFDQRYTIEYRSVEATQTGEDKYEDEAFTYFVGDVNVFEYNPSSKDEVLLPGIKVMTRTDKVFLGWYTKYDKINGFNTENKVTSFIPYSFNEKTNQTEIQTGKKIYYAQWGDLDIYVSADGKISDDGIETGTGAKDSPFKTLNRAFSRITNYPNKNLNWTIHIDGEVTAAVQSGAVIESTTEAESITIIGDNGSGKDNGWADADSLVLDTKYTVLTIDANFPVTLKNLTIQHKDGVEGRGLKLGDTNSNTIITLEDVKVCNNKLSNESGAGIYNQFNLTLKKCEISNNTAGEISDQGGAGGGIFSRGELSLVDCLIESNTAGDKGGGIYNSGNLTLKENCIISGNNAVTGGGVQNEKTMTISKSRFEGNTVDKKIDKNKDVTYYPYGGAIHITSESSAGCTVAIDKTTFINNTALEGYGGAISVKGSSGKTTSITLNDNVTIGGENGTSGNENVGNTAKYGGGIYIYGPLTNATPPDCKIIGANVNISYNNADYGAGIYLQSANLDMESGSSSIIKNTATNEGGGICAKYAAATINGSISENKAPTGAGLYSYDSSITLTGKIINNAAEENGGGIYFERFPLATSDKLSITMSDDASVSGNTAKNGGGLYCVSKNTYPTVFAMNGGTVRGNTAIENGGGVYIVGEDAATKFTFNMADGNISGNTASTNGGGVYIGQYGEMFMYGSAVVGDADATSVATKASCSNRVVKTDGTADGAGGGIYNGGELYLGYTAADTPATDEKVFVGGVYQNYAKSGSGIYNAATLEMLGGQIIFNYASAEGGGVDNVGESAVFNFRGGAILKNKSRSGGGIYNAGEINMTEYAVVGDPAATVSATSSNYSNYATLAGGGIYNLTGSTLNIAKTCKIYFNYAAEGGGIFNSGTLNNSSSENANVIYNTASGTDEEENKDNVYNPE